MTRQRNLILSTAVAAAFSATAMSAHAGVASALPAKIATAALQSNTQVVKGNQLSYSTQVPLSNNTIYFLYVKLLTGTFTGPPGAALLSSPNNAALNTALAGATSQISADATFAVYTLAKTTGAVGVNSLILFTPSGTNTGEGGVDGLTSLLSGGNVNEQMSIGSSANTTSVLADIDSAAGGNIITFTAPEAYLACSSGAGPTCSSTLGFGTIAAETTQINVSGGTGVAVTPTVWTGASTSLVDFGGFKVTDIPGVLNAFQTSSWNIADEYSAGSLAATVTGNFAAASAVYLSGTANCATSSNGLTLNTAKTSATLAGGTLLGGSGVGQVFCMAVNGTSTIPATTPAINITLTTSAGAVQAGAPLSFGPSSLYSLLPNGGTVIIRAYLPAATSFNDVVRIINIGQVAASVSVARIDPVTGAIGPSGVLAGGPMAAGAATNFTNTVIEAALGGPLPAGDRPRLLFTANTQIEGQNYIINPDGTVTTLHGTDAGGSP